MNRPVGYQILVGGTLDESWSQWFSGMQVDIIRLPDGQLATRLSGQVADQAALFGILLRIRDLNLELIHVEKRTC